jgi:hypothetical protein
VADGLVAPSPSAAAPWATDGVLASQLGPRSRPAAGARALVVGVLQQAIADAARPDRMVTSPARRTSVQTDAVRWIASDATAPFGFRWTCETSSTWTPTGSGRAWCETARAHGSRGTDPPQLRAGVVRQRRPWYRR